jgi:hypothetical protein
MNRFHFSQLPLAARVAVGLAFYDTWWCLEEFVIDRHGIWKYLPGYVVGDPCIWDLLVAGTIVVFIWRASRSPKQAP